MEQPKVVAVVGPTAVGKSDLAVALARLLDGEVVGADASQLYRGMDIGTAKLSPAEREGVPHHQLDVLEVRQEASVAAYQRGARADVEEILRRGHRPIVVGGSGLYVRAALDELDIPPTDPRVRGRWQAQLDDLGPAALHDRLLAVDPAAAGRILPTNGRRIVRALEVIELTGRPFSATMPTRRFVRPTVMIGLRADRAVIDERIDRRARRMWQHGLLEEVRRLIDHGLREGRTASRSIGYAQALAQLDGALPEQEAISSTSAATRRLARRQLSWFRPDPRVNWLEHDAPDLLGQAVRLIRDEDGR